MLSIKKTHIDARFKSSDSASHSDFNIDSPTAFLIPEGTGFYIDDVCIPHSFIRLKQASATNFSMCMSIILRGR